MAVREFYGIGGWLLGFLVVVALFAAWNVYTLVYGMLTLPGFEAQFGPLPLDLLIEGWLFAIGRIVIPLAILKRLIQRREASSVRFAIAAIWLLLLALPLLKAGVDYYNFPGRPWFWSALGAELSRNLLIGVAGSWYLRDSKRVARTYPDRSKDALAEVFE